MKKKEIFETDCNVHSSSIQLLYIDNVSICEVDADEQDIWMFKVILIVKTKNFLCTL